VALFSLDQHDAIPVDTHVWAVARRDMAQELRAAEADKTPAQAQRATTRATALPRSLTPTVYQRIGDAFRARYGPLAGWAHCLLFAAELRVFRARLPEDFRADIEHWERQERDERLASKRERKAAQPPPRAQPRKRSRGELPSAQGGGEA